MTEAVDLVLIGRNEGSRLAAALDAAQGQARRIVYVDSGSTDDSLALAERAGVEIVRLAPEAPFTAARARNAGFAALDAAGGAAPLVQFIDGDCRIVAGWTARAAAHLATRPDTALVTGWRAETHPEASLYNRLCDWEWHRPAGEIATCGGDMMVRSAAFRALGGFDPQVIAAEDDEFCTRLRKAGWRLDRLPVAMTRHDAAMLRFGQWWRRAERTGHGFAQVGRLHPDHFVAERRRALVYAGAVPAAALALAVAAPALAPLPLAAWPLNWARTARKLRRDGMAPGEARAQAALLTLSKLPNLLGMARFHLRRLRRAPMRLIEYK
ncbi:glycosyltransferase family 2 protein [Roseivivax sp. CAU 1761]